MAVCDALLSVAVIVADPLEMIVPAAAVKVAVVAFAATVTEAGVVKAALLEESETAVPPAGAELESVTVQVLFELDARVVGTHWTDERLTGAWRVMVAVLEVLLRVAVTVADPPEAIVPAVAVKLAVVELAGTLTDAGTVKDALLDERETEVAAVSEAFVRVTVQELVALEPKVVGAH